MYLKSVSGKILFEGRFSSVKRAVEQAVKDKVDLNGVDLRGAKLPNAELDSANLQNANLWGANLTGANITEADLSGADCRNTNLKEACIAETNCAHTQFQGSYFSNTILTNSNFAHCQFSCPSLFNLELKDALSFDHAIYHHHGEQECDLSERPIIVKNLPQRVVLFKNKAMIGNEIYNLEFYDAFLSGFSKIVNNQKSQRLKQLH